MSGPEYTSLPATDVDNMSGNIFVPNTPGSDENTLDEPISTTLVRSIIRLNPIKFMLSFNANIDSSYYKLKWLFGRTWSLTSPHISDEGYKSGGQQVLPRDNPT